MNSQGTLNNRRKRVLAMTRGIAPSSPQLNQVQKPGLWNRFTQKIANLTSNEPLQTMLAREGKTGFKKLGGRRRLKEYELRALSELSYRSPKVVQMNLKTLKNKSNTKNLARALKQSRSKTRKYRR
jgi:hypothetical protein